MKMLVRIKVYTWRGHPYVENTESDFAGVDWILADNWWPYQRPTFVTPNFAGYVSGHSTYSRAAAEMLENFTRLVFPRWPRNTFSQTKRIFSFRRWSKSRC